MSLPLAAALFFIAACGSSKPARPPSDGGNNDGGLFDLGASDQPLPPDAADGDDPDQGADAALDGSPAEFTPGVVLGPWTSRDVGDVGTVKGSLTATSSVFTVRGGGGAIGGTSDAFFFASQRLSGDGEIVARVKSLLKVKPESRIGVMMRADVGSSRVDLQACKLEYSIVSPK